MMWRGSTLLVALTLVSKASVLVLALESDCKLTVQVDNSLESQPHADTVSDEEYILRSVDSLYAAAGGAGFGRPEMQTSGLLQTRLRAWKRNADLINSLLALPKGMNDAGR